MTNLEYILIDKGLTRRQAEVCLGVAQGLSNKAIAEKLFVEPTTIKAHLRTAYKSLGITRRYELIKLSARYLEENVKGMNGIGFQ